jgi:hypothetical protein
MMTATYILCVFLLIAIPAHITAFKTGAPEAVCDSMIPDHHSTPQSGPSPYTITPNKFKVKAGDPVEVTISGSDSTKFKGYLIQARVGNTPIGRFLKAPEINLLNCGSGVGVRRVCQFCFKGGNVCGDTIQIWLKSKATL